MTVAVLKDDYRKTNEKGLLDLEATLSCLASAEEVLEAACKNSTGLTDTTI